MHSPGTMVLAFKPEILPRSEGDRSVLSTRIVVHKIV